MFILLKPEGMLPQNTLMEVIPQSKREKIIKEGEKYLGLKYRSKVEHTIFDCSG